MVTSQEVKAKLAKIIRTASDYKGSSNFQTEGKGNNPGKDSVEEENANTGNKSYPSAESKTEHKE